MKTSTRFLPTGASPENVPPLISRTLGGAPGIPKWISPVGTGLPSMLTIPLTGACGTAPGRVGPQPMLQAIANARQTAKGNRYIGEFLPGGESRRQAEGGCLPVRREAVAARNRRPVAGPVEFHHALRPFRSRRRDHGSENVSPPLRVAAADRVWR